MNKFDILITLSLQVPDENVCTVETVDYNENNGTFKYNVSGLHIFTAYEIHVKAFTAKGSGPNASQRVNTSEDSTLWEERGS
mgnify:CR=1 FL=1